MRRLRDGGDEAEREGGGTNRAEAERDKRRYKVMRAMGRREDDGGRAMAGGKR